MTVLELISQHNFGDFKKQYKYEDGTSANLIKLEKLKGEEVGSFSVNVETRELNVILKKDNSFYLEDVLFTLDIDAKVHVVLSSSTTYDKDITIRDGCGNHQAKIWVKAINKGNLENMFKVEKVECKFEVDCIQYIIYLEDDKNELTYDLYRLASDAAHEMDEFGY